MLPFFVKNYSTKECPLIYAFCIEHKPIYILKPNQVMEKYYRAEDKLWASDGKVYRNLSLD
jgi:hypothetical protein